MTSELTKGVYITQQEHSADFLLNESYFSLS
jgi:hypothetical protein